MDDVEGASLEAELAATEDLVDAALRASAALVRELKKAKVGAARGQVRDLRRALSAAADLGADAAKAAQAAAESFAIDEQWHLASGDYARELLAAAAARNLTMVEADDRLLCYPSLIRVLPADAAVEIDRRRERRLRPSVLVDLLAAAQARPPRFRPEPFLESLEAGYDLVARPRWTPRGRRRPPGRGVGCVDAAPGATARIHQAGVRSRPLPAGLEARDHNEVRSRASLAGQLGHARFGDSDHRGANRSAAAVLGYLLHGSAVTGEMRPGAHGAGGRRARCG